MNNTVGYTSFELDFEKISKTDRARSSSPKKSGKPKILKKIFKKRNLFEFEFIAPKKPKTLAEKMVKVRAEREEIQRKMCVLEKKIQERKFNFPEKNLAEIGIEINSPMKNALIQKAIIQKRLARRRSANK